MPSPQATTSLRNDLLASCRPRRPVEPGAEGMVACGGRVRRLGGPELPSLERRRNESGGRAQPLHPTPSTMGWEFDRHHLPSWRPEPPFLPGRIAKPSRPRAPGAAYPSSNRPKREPSKEKYKEPLAVLAVGRLRSRHWSGARSCSASTWPPSASWPPTSSLPPRRRHQDLEPDAA